MMPTLATTLCTAVLALGAHSPTAPETCARVVEVAIEEGVPAELAVALAWHESRLSTTARSAAGAVGAMQVMPATLRRCRAELGGAEACGPIRAGVRELGRLLGKYEARRALAFYNAGPTKSAAAWAKAMRWAGAVLQTSVKFSAPEDSAAASPAAVARP